MDHYSELQERSELAHALYESFVGPDLDKLPMWSELDSVTYERWMRTAGWVKDHYEE